MNKAFFDAVRASLFGGKLSQGQVSGIEAIMAAWDRSGDGDDRKLAYLLATVCRETGWAMVPNRENLNYSVDGLLKTFSRERISTADARKYGRSKSQPANQKAIANIVYGGAWGKENLGNTQPNDGWDFRGGGYEHLTGRANYRKVGIKLDVPLLDNPDKILDPVVAGMSIVRGSLEGWYTGKKLGDYINSDKTDYINARRVINGTDKAALIAGYAEKFETAIAAGRKSPQKPVEPPKPIPQPNTPSTKPHWLSTLISAILSLLKRKD